MLTVISLLALVGSFFACAPQQATDDSEIEYSVDFLGRTIDLEPYFQSYPYEGWRADFEAGKLFYEHITPDGTWMMVQDLSFGAGPIDPAAGRVLNDIDWSTRNLWVRRYDKTTGDMIVQADEKNDEVFNLYRLSLEDGSLTKLTDVPYIYGWNFSKDGTKIGYIARHGDSEPYRSCLTLLELETGHSSEVFCEEGAEYRMVWTTVNFRPDDSGVVIRMNRNGHRSYGTLVYVDLADPEAKLLLPEGLQRKSVGSEEKGWLDNDRFVYSSDETGFTNLYLYDLTSNQTRALTSVEENAWFNLLELEGRRLILQVLDRPHENVMQVLDFETAALLTEQVMDVSLMPIGFDDKSRFVMAMSSVASPFRADDLQVELDDDQAAISMQAKIRLPEEYTRTIEQCRVERVEYPTFDIDPDTGEQRLLHAFLMTPKQPREDQSQLAVITSFYGGGNYFSERQQIFCEAGIAWLSPAVRGSFGFGKAFGALNDGDLGGDEIIDLFYGARFLEEKLGLEPDQIGVAGGSHGGYATMRALTFPPETNDRNEAYDFGFGMSHAGFSSIVTFYDATNIPDWIILEAGDPKSERAKLEDRSPLNHIDLLKAPILLTHGANDNRVGVSESRQFVEAARAAGKPVTYVELEGQGHGISGLENQVSYFQTLFDFLEKVVCEQYADDAPT
jgi:dipeptidyl aminopeptidase/acylaminoacyl peptidase